MVGIMAIEASPSLYKVLFPSDTFGPRSNLTKRLLVVNANTTTSYRQKWLRIGGNRARDAEVGRVTNEGKCGRDRSMGFLCQNAR
jgi:hypothetical protein